MKQGGNIGRRTARPGWPGVAGLILVTVATSFAQLDLGALNTQTVKTGQPFAAIDTKVDEVALNIQVDRGVVTTVATLTYTPSKGTVSEYVCQPEVCAAPDCVPRDCRTRVVKELALDSLETSTGFSQADNTVITDMYLWVGETKVRADLQDRALASAQYEDIVKRRRDPALIETWGNGYYNLRIFPNESGQARKIEIEFVQGMENEGTGFHAMLPVIHRLAKVAAYGAVDYASLPNRTIGNLSLTATAVDGKTYRLAWEGLGSGDVGATPLRLQAKDVAELKTGTLSGSTTACSGCLTPWTAEKAGTAYFGAKAALIAKQIAFEAEPDARHFLLDVDGKDTLVASRARKVALLSMKAYAAGTTHQANLAFADGKGGLAWVFPQGVSMDAENLRKAYDALKAWRPNADADAHATLRAYARTRGAGSATSSVAYLINNDTTAYYNWNIGSDGMVKGGDQADYEAWEKARSAAEDETLAALKASNSLLFGFWNDYRLNRIASATGGFQVGALHGYIYYPMGGGIVTDIAPDKAAPLAGIHLPPLFGPGRPDAWSISALEVKASRLVIDNLVVLQPQRHWGYFDVMPIRGEVAASDMILPYQRPSQDTVILRLSGLNKGSGPVSFTVTGIWGGLRFSQEFKADLPSAAGSGPLGAGIWAYQQTESWGRSLAKIGLEAYKGLGRDYHIVNRQMSLLALEPGVPLWTEMPAKDGGDAVAGREFTAGGPATDSKIASPGGQSTAASLDRASLEDILNGTVGVSGPVADKVRGAGGLALRRTGSTVSLAWDLTGAESGSATFRILDLSGKAVAEVRGARTATGYAGEWRHPGQPGLYLVVARADGRTAVRKLVLSP